MKTLSFIFFLALTAVILFFCSCDIFGNEDTNVSDGNYMVIDSNGNVGWCAGMAFDNGNLYICYYDYSNRNLKFAKSTDYGISLETRTIDSAGNVGAGCSILALSSRIYISYSDVFDDHPIALKVAISDNFGDTWDMQTLVTGDNVGGNTSISGEGSDIYICYSDCFELRIIKSTNGGISWPSTSIREIESSIARDPSLFVQGNNIYVSYFDVMNSALLFSKSVDGGETWLSENRKIVDSEEFVGEYSTLFVAGENLFISYNSNSYSALKYANSTDGGTTWNNAFVDNTDAVGSFTSIAVDGSNIFISYCHYYNEMTDEGGHLKFAISNNSGSTWTISTLDSNRDVGWFTSLIVDGSNIYICYYDHYEGDLKFIKSMNGGVTFQ